MVAGKITHLAGKTGTAIGKKNFGFAETTGIEQNITARRMHGVIFKSKACIKIAQRHPDGFAAPAGMNDLVFEGQ